MTKKSIDLEMLIRGCGDDSEDGGIQIRTALEPLGGSMAPVKPSTYAASRAGDPPRFQEDQRWWGDPPTRTEAIVVDNVPSQANRIEAALGRLVEEFGLPEIRIDFSDIGGLPSHLPRRLTSYEFPHRHADAYLRDAEEEGRAFEKSNQGLALLNATLDEPGELFRWFPQSLLLGYWQTHLGKKRTQAKLARSWTSEIVGFAPATSSSDRTRVVGTKGDGLNLSSDEGVEFDEDDLLSGWRPTASTKVKLAAIGYGQVPYGDASLAGVSFRAIEQTTTVAFAGLRRINCSAEGRALLVALGLAGFVAAFGRAFVLRSGCELRPLSRSWIWLGDAGDAELEPLSSESAGKLLRAAVDAAGDLVQGGGWGEPPKVLKPNSKLSEAIRKTWPLVD